MSEQTRLFDSQDATTPQPRAPAEAPPSHEPHDVHLDDNLAVLTALPDDSIDLIYVDPPFNTGTERRHDRLATRRTADDDGDRTGFGGHAYTSEVLQTLSYDDTFDDYLGWIAPRLEEARRVLTPTGALYVHLDWREAHYVRVLMDAIFGRDHFINEVIWAYDFGGRSKRRWPRKHENILYYAMDPDDYTFNRDVVDRIPYMAPGLVSREKAERGKFPTDTWWHTVVGTNAAERTGYPTQKPLGILRRIVGASSNPGDTVLDFCAGSGTTGMACHELGRRFVLVDDNPEAVAVMADRFEDVPRIRWHGYDPNAAPGDDG